MQTVQTLRRDPPAFTVTIGTRDFTGSGRKSGWCQDTFGALSEHAQYNMEVVETRSVGRHFHRLKKVNPTSTAHISDIYSQLDADCIQCTQTSSPEPRTRTRPAPRIAEEGNPQNSRETWRKPWRGVTSLTATPDCSYKSTRHTTTRRIRQPTAPLSSAHEILHTSYLTQNTLVLPFQTNAPAI